MGRHLSMIACLVLVAACGGDSKKPPPKRPVVKKEEPPPPPEPTAEEKRAKALAAIVPEDSTCLPLALKEPDAPRLELAAVGSDAVICATDTARDRALGVVGCWKIKLDTGELAWRSRDPIPSRGYTRKLDDNCAGELCLPKDSKAPEDGAVLLAASPAGDKQAMLAGDNIHIFADGKHETTWGIRTEKGITSEPQRIHWVGEHVFVEGTDGVWVYKAADGTAVGPIIPLGARDGKPIAPPKGGSLVVLDKQRVAVSERGFTFVHTYEADTGKRAKLVRKTARSPCKTADTNKYWNGEDVPAKCKDFMDKTYAHLVGADVVAGSKNLLVLLRGPRLGELAVLDARSLAEKTTIRLPWCDDEDGGGDKPKADAPKDDEEEESSDEE